MECEAYHIHTEENRGSKMAEQPAKEAIPG
jgi:hypothetical protein